MVLAFAVTGGVALQKGMKSGLVGRLVGSSTSMSMSCPMAKLAPPSTPNDPA